MKKNSLATLVAVFLITAFLFEGAVSAQMRVVVPQAADSAWAAPTVSPDVVISQVYGGAGTAGATYNHDYVELFNRGNSIVPLTGKSVQYASAAGNTWQVTPLSGSIQPGQHFLVQENTGIGTNSIPTPDASGTISMSGTNG